MPFRTSVPVRFGDVDHAGIVFYPRFFIYFHEAFERFFDDAGLREGPQLRYKKLLDERHVSFPTVHIETDYKQPLKYGDSLDLEVSVPRIGNRSATFRYDGYRHVDGKHAVTCHITVVCVDMRTFTSIDLPDDLRALFERFAK